MASSSTWRRAQRRKGVKMERNERLVKVLKWVGIAILGSSFVLIWGVGVSTLAQKYLNSTMETAAEEPVEIVETKVGPLDKTEEIPVYEIGEYWVEKERLPLDAMSGVSYAPLKVFDFYGFLESRRGEQLDFHLFEDETSETMMLAVEMPGGGPRMTMSCIRLGEKWVSSFQPGTAATWIWDDGQDFVHDAHHPFMISRTLFELFVQVFDDGEFSTSEKEMLREYPTDFNDATD